MSDELLKVESISFEYSQNSILSDVSFILNKGEIGVILGPSGCGKTTLLRIIAGLEKIQKGKILINQQIVNSPSAFIPPQARKIAYVFQDYALFPHMTVSQNILFGVTNQNQSSQQEVLKNMLSLFQLESEINKYPHQLSGGQQQRVAIARSLAAMPEILLLDEPFSNLDVNMREEIIFELKEIFKTLKITALFVTHDIGEAFSMADKMGVLQNGVLLQWDTPFEIFYRPQSKLIVSTLQSGNILECEIKENIAYSIFGEVKEIPLPDNFQGNKKCFLYLPNGSINLTESGKYVGIIKKAFFTGKVQHFSIEVNEKYTIQAVSHSKFYKKNKESCNFDVKYEGSVFLPFT